MPYDHDSLLANFPHDDFRPGQKEALLEIGDTFEVEDKQFAIAELPTGTGKSPIAKAVAGAAIDGYQIDHDQFQSRMHNLMNGDESFATLLSEENIPKKAFIVTSQKPLQDQYFHEFGYPEIGSKSRGNSQGHIYDVRGKGNYKCSYPKNKYETTCRDNERTCSMMGSDACSYTWERMQAQAHPIASTNSTFFAVGTDRWAKRSVTIIDECHNTPDDVLNLVSFSMSDSILHECGLIDHLYDESLKEHHIKGTIEIDSSGFTYWIESLIKPIENHIEILTNMKTATEDDQRLLDKLEEILRRMIRYLDTCSRTEWIVEAKVASASRVFTARPLESGYFAPGMFLRQSSRTLLQSATITDVRRFAGDMGIEVGQYNFIQKASPFPLLHRPVFNMSTVWMNQKSIEGSLDDLCIMIQKIIDAYPIKKGIIHCHTYKLQKEIIERLTSDRIITHDSFNREEALKEHITSEKPTILLSPSMTEGLDLKGELARFSIVCKLPFQYLGDRRIKRKCDIDPGWGNYQTAKTLVQSVGRGVRSEKDWCHTYILDKAFDSFANRAPLPPDFLNSVLSASNGNKVLKEAARKYY